MAREFNEQELIKRNKLEKLRSKNSDPFLIQKFDRNYNSASFKQEFDKYTKEELHENTTNVLIAGRVIAIRQTFGVIQDFFGKVQYY
jgi:lysyl-tRNA synthetase class 2